MVPNVPVERSVQLAFVPVPRDKPIARVFVSMHKRIATTVELAETLVSPVSFV